MRLADFILGNIEPILVQWDKFARSIWPRAEASPVHLRDHAEAMLRSIASDMISDQSASQQITKSKGGEGEGVASAEVVDTAKAHAFARLRSGFDPMALVAEYRALRASVIRLWGESIPSPDSRDLADLTRFNESVDQSLTEAVRQFTEQMDQSRKIFLGILGHDLRNPLNAILLSSQAIAEIPEAGPECAHLAAQITASSEAMTHMLADFLDFTASRLGQRIPVTRSAMDLTALCQAVVSECQASFPSRTLRLELQGDLKGEWDQARLRQLLSNLLGNAIYHGSPTALITVSVDGEASSVQLRVHNTGTPIAQDLLPRIFDPLVQGLSSELKGGRRPGSMGLGLYIAREVVSAHGGTIGVQSTSDTGTVFTVWLPRHLNQDVPSD
jgi:signal transduction histidine kinase